MHTGSYVFAQIMAHLPRRTFQRCVARYQGEHYVKRFSCRDQFLAMAFGQLSSRESLRDVVTCLAAQKTKRYHLGFKHRVTKTTLSRANERRDWRIYRDLASALIQEARHCYVDEPDIARDLAGACYAIDATSIELALSLFPWAPYMKTKAAVKLHLVMDLRGSIPTFFDLTSGKASDVGFLDTLCFEAGAFYVLDRGYLDFGRLHALHTAGAFFVIRTKKHIRLARHYSRPVDKAAGIRCDQIVTLAGIHTPEKYPDTLRRIKYYDREANRVYEFLTNNTEVSASSIALLYKHRWQIELFFKWIKQHLKIKAFWGYSENAVKTQICIALCTYLIVAILKKRLGIQRDLYEILQITSVSLFDNIGLVELFSTFEVQKPVKGPEYTASLFDD